MRTSHSPLGIALKKSVIKLQLLTADGAETGWSDQVQVNTMNVTLGIIGALSYGSAMSVDHSFIDTANHRVFIAMKPGLIPAPANYLFVYQDIPATVTGEKTPLLPPPGAGFSISPFNSLLSPDRAAAKANFPALAVLSQGTTAQQLFAIRYTRPGTCTITSTGHLNVFSPRIAGFAQKPSKTWDITVVKVDSLLPDKGTEVDDGDGDDDTKLFVVDISDTPGDVVTVTATPNPPLAEADLPAFWTLTGGTGASKLTRTISQTTPSESLLICSCGNSSKVTTIYVVRCRFRAYSEKGALDAGNPGHGWWKLALRPASANALLPVADRIWVNIEIGYFSLNWTPIGPGYVRVGAQGHTPTAQYDWDITFSALAMGVTYGRLLFASPGTYNFTMHNCVHETISAGAAAGVAIHTTPASSFSPDGLHDWLIALPPP